jgi:ethanolamine ammonia-lyase small subunit
MKNMDFGQKMRANSIQKKRDEAVQAKTWVPRGFDISLADAISELNMNKEQIQLVGELTATRKIANAKVGRNVFYRKATIERLLAKSNVTVTVIAENGDAIELKPSSIELNAE